MDVNGRRGLRGPRVCKHELMEHDWDEGYTCSLTVAAHGARHRAEGDGIFENNTSTDDKGRKYKWVFEWWYIPAPKPEPITGPPLRRIR